MKPKVNNTIWSVFHSDIKTEKKYQGKLCRKRKTYLGRYSDKDGKHVISVKKAFVMLFSLPFLVLVLPFMLLSELDSTLDNMCRARRLT